MTEKNHRDKDHIDALIKYWMEKARESMEAAQSEYDSERIQRP
jgi:hypothetical protein